MKIRKSKFVALLWIVAILCISIGVCGCDLEGLFEDMENQEWRKFHFELNTLVYSEYSGAVASHVLLKFSAHKKYSESGDKVPETYIFASRDVYSDPVKWEFDYEILYDKEKKKYMEFVVITIYAHYIDPSGELVGLSNAGYLKIYPSGGGWSALKFSELSGSTMFDRKYMVRFPLDLYSGHY
jgi:hypothetical protein